MSGEGTVAAPLLQETAAGENGDQPPPTQETATTPRPPLARTGYHALPPWRQKLRKLFFPCSLISEETLTDPGKKRYLLDRGIYENFMVFLLLLHLFLFAFLYDPYYYMYEVMGEDGVALVQRNSTYSETFTICELQPKGCTRGAKDQMNILAAFDFIFSLVYVLDWVLQVGAFGIRVISSPWRLLDLGIVLTNCLVRIVSFSGVPRAMVFLAVVRVIRIFRPVLHADRNSWTHAVIVGFKHCVQELGDISFLFVLFVVWFSIAGIQQFRGNYRYRCVADEFSRHVGAIGDGRNTWAELPSSSTSLWLRNHSIDEYVCGGSFDVRRGVADTIGCTPRQTCAPLSDAGVPKFARGYFCPFEYSCLVVDYPCYGYLGYGNMAQATLTTFMMITFTNVFDGMYWARDATTFLTNGYFLCLISVGGFLLVNLILFAIVVEFGRKNEAEQAKIATQNERERPPVLTAANTASGADDSGHGRTTSLAAPLLSDEDRTPRTEERETTTETEGTTTDIPPRSDVREMKPSENEGILQITEKGDTGTTQETQGDSPHVVPPEETTANSTDNSSSIEEGDLHKWLPESLLFLADKLELVRRFCFHVTSHEAFDHATTAVTALNILTLCMYHYNMNETYELIIDETNVLFLFLFVLETLFRFGATMNPRHFFTDPHNTIDVAIVFSPLLELVYFPWRALRVLRCLKFLRSFPMIEEWLLCVIQAMLLGPFPIALITMALFIFAVIGVQMFGGRFCGLEDRSDSASRNGGICEGLPLAHFDDFGNAMLSALQVIVSDNWHGIMYNAMKVRGAYVAVFFVILYLIGNFLFLNLFVAILLSSRSLITQARKQRDFLGDFSDTATKIPRGRAHAVFDGFFTFAILVSSVEMGLEDGLQPPDTTYSRALYYCDIVVTCIFVLEMIIKIVRHGFIFGKDTYLRRSHWNKFDFVLVCVSVAGLIPRSISTDFLLQILMTIIRVLRVFRPLRLLVHLQGMRVLIWTLYKAFRKLMYVSALGMMFLIIWGVGGVYLFAGKLRKCNVNDVWYPELPMKNCTALGGSFENDGPHFDHIGASLLSVFQVVTLNEWASVMYRTMDAVGVNEPPERNAFPAASLFVISAAVFGGFFFINIFGAVLIAAYNHNSSRTANSRARLLTRLRKARRTTVSRIFQLFPATKAELIEVSTAEGGVDTTSGDMDLGTSYVLEDNPTLHFSLSFSGASFSDRVQNACRYLVKSRVLEKCTFAVISMDLILTASNYVGEPFLFRDALLGAHTAVLLFYFSEMVIKMLGFSVKQYFAGLWNRFDAFLTIVAFLVLLMDILAVVTPHDEEFQSASGALALLQTLRVLRLVHFKEKSKLEELLIKIFRAVSDLRHGALLCFITLYIFAVAAQKIFERVYTRPFGSQTGLDTHNNFWNIWNSMMMLIASMAQGAWPSFYRDLRVEPPYCDREIGNCGLPSPYPEIFFVLLLFLFRFVLRNLVVAVMINSFSNNRRSLALSKKDAATFGELWHIFDPELRKSIHPKDLITFLRAIPAHSAFGRHNRKYKQARFATEVRILTAMQLRNLEDRVSLNTVVAVLCDEAFTSNLAIDRKLKIADDRARNDVLVWGEEQDIGEENESPDRGEGSYRHQATILMIGHIMKERITRQRRASRRASAYKVPQDHSTSSPLLDTEKGKYPDAKVDECPTYEPKKKMEESENNSVEMAERKATTPPPAPAAQDSNPSYGDQATGEKPEEDQKVDTKTEDHKESGTTGRTTTSNANTDAGTAAPTGTQEES